MKTLESALREYADKHMPLDEGWPDSRGYWEHTNEDALTDAWLRNRTSYIWRVGVLGQWDSNKCDYAYAVIGYERQPGQIQVLGHIAFPEGENDDIGRVLQRALGCLSAIHPAFDPG